MEESETELVTTEQPEPEPEIVTPDEAYKRVYEAAIASGFDQQEALARANYARRNPEFVKHLEEAKPKPAPEKPKKQSKPKKPKKQDTVTEQTVEAQETELAQGGIKGAKKGGRGVSAPESLRIEGELYIRFSVAAEQVGVAFQQVYQRAILSNKIRAERVKGMWYANQEDVINWAATRRPRQPKPTPTESEPEPEPVVSSEEVEPKAGEEQ